MGEQYPGKLFASCLTTAPDGSSFIGDGIKSVAKLAAGLFEVKTFEPIDPSLCVAMAGAAAAVPGSGIAGASVLQTAPDTFEVHTGGVQQVPAPVGFFSSSQENFPFGVLPAAGGPYHAQYPGGAAIASAGPFSQFQPARTVQIVSGIGTVPTVFTVTGTRFGVAQVETINVAGAGTVQGALAFDTITNFASDVDPVGTTDLQTGNGFGVSGPYIPTPTEALNGAPEVIAAPSPAQQASGTIIPNTPPDGLTTNYTIRFSTVAQPLTGGQGDVLFALAIYRTSWPTK